MHFLEFAHSEWDPLIVVWKSEDEWTFMALDTLGSRDTEVEVLLVVKKGDRGTVDKVVRSVGRKGGPPV